MGFQLFLLARSPDVAARSAGVRELQLGSLWQVDSAFPECEGFPFTSGGHGVEVVFATCCFRVRTRPQPSAIWR